MGLLSLSALSVFAFSAAATVVPKATDPCAAIGGQKWVAPSAVRACFESFPINETTKSNVRYMALLGSTLNHSRINYRFWRL